MPTAPWTLNRSRQRAPEAQDAAPERPNLKPVPRKNSTTATTAAATAADNSNNSSSNSSRQFQQQQQRTFRCSQQRVHTCQEDKQDHHHPLKTISRCSKS